MTDDSPRTHRVHRPRLGVGQIGWERIEAHECPVLICASCEEPIRPGEPAIVEWVMFTHEPLAAHELATGEKPYWFRHKATVCPKGDIQAAAGVALGWEDLADFFRFLLTNTLDDEQLCRQGIELHAITTWEGERTRRGGPQRIGGYAVRAPKPRTSAATRRSISQRRRYAILQRDGFRCQLCGRSAEEHGVALEVDHQQPISKGGTNDDANLWTLCRDCNAGKSDRC